MKFLTRLYRKLTSKCVVCGRPTHDIGYWYCSFTCMGYDGCFSAKADHPNNKRKPKLFRKNCVVHNYKEFGEKYL